jgi:hypothetical protein
MRLQLPRGIQNLPGDRSCGENCGIGMAGCTSALANFDRLGKSYRVSVGHEIGRKIQVDTILISRQIVQGVNAIGVGDSRIHVALRRGEMNREPPSLRMDLLYSHDTMAATPDWWNDCL